MQRVLLTAAMVCAPAALFAQFEGAITVGLASPQGSQQMTYQVRGSVIRLDFTGNGMAGYVLHDNEKNTTKMVMPAQRMYMDMSALQGMVAQETAKSSPTDFKLTGKKETIAGYECEHGIVTSDDGQYDVCLAKGLGSFYMQQGPMGRGRAGGPPAALARLGRDLFPLKVQKVGGDVSLQVTKIEKKSLDPSMFTIPDGFQSMSMPGRPPL